MVPLYKLLKSSKNLQDACDNKTTTRSRRPSKKTISRWTWLKIGRSFSSHIMPKQRRSIRRPALLVTNNDIQNFSINANFIIEDRHSRDSPGERFKGMLVVELQRGGNPISNHTFNIISHIMT